METCRMFDREEPKNWLKGVFALSCLQKPLERFIDKEIENFHKYLLRKFSLNQCANKCDATKRQLQPKQKPFSGCKVCSAWRDAILKNHTSPEGEVFWKNIEPHLWFQEKWEVAKVFMTKGQKNKKSIGDFDIAALLSLMKQCKHFKKFELGGLCEKVSNVRNNIMHSAHFKLKQEDLHIYLHHIRALGEELAKYDLDFKSLLEDIDEIQNLDFRLVLPDNMAVEEIQAQHEKEREDILFAAVQLVENRNTEEYLRRKVERLEQRVSECDKEMQTLRLSNKTELRKLQERIDHCDRKMEKMQSAVAQKALEHNHTRMQLETLGRRMAQLEQETMANLDEQQTSSNMLVRALVTCICQSAIICENPCRLDVKQIKQLQKYLKDEQMELQALYALQALMVQMEHPDCLLRLFFDILYDEGMIKEEVFYKWESSRDPDEQQGKGMALRSVIAFFTWLREAEYDSESESESESDNSPPPCWENQWEFREDLLG